MNCSHINRQHCAEAQFLGSFNANKTNIVLWNDLLTNSNVDMKFSERPLSLMNSQNRVHNDLYPSAEEHMAKQEPSLFLSNMFSHRCMCIKDLKFSNAIILNEMFVLSPNKKYTMKLWPTSNYSLFIFLMTFMTLLYSLCFFSSSSFHISSHYLF